MIDRLHRLHPRLIDLSLDRLHRLLAQLGHPERRLPPILHVAGTNGKGSTCAMIRALAEAAGSRVHVYTSPHLVRFNERFRVAGQLVSDQAMADMFEHVERVNDGAPITVFEVITAVGFALFAQTPADLLVLEVGLGGRGDATNVIDRPAATAITSISLDHRELLGETLAEIAGEKAGIMKPGIPTITGAQPGDVLRTLQAHADQAGSRLLARGRDWQIRPMTDGLQFTDDAGMVEAPRPALLGAHQIDNAGIALATLRAGAQAYAARGLADATWPARLQRLHGRFAALLPPDWELWLDGGHNPGAGLVLADQAQAWADRPLHIVVGMKQSKDATEFLRPLLAHAATLWAVQEPGQHLALDVAEIVTASGGVARPGPDVAGALRQMQGEPARVLICGSLYLAGEVLKHEGF